MIQLLNILMCPAPGEMTHEEIHAHNMHTLYLVLIVLGIYLFFTLGGIILNKILKKTDDHCTWQGAMPLAPIGNIVCFFCRLRYFLMPKTYKKFNEIKKKKNEAKKKKLQEQIKAEAEKARREFEERIKQKTKGLTDI